MPVPRGASPLALRYGPSRGMLDSSQPTQRGNTMSVPRIAARTLAGVSLAMLVMVTLAMLATLTPWARIDAFPSLHTFGYSVGGNAYCSVEWSSGHLSATCERAS